MHRKGILLAGGKGTRFRPVTLAVNKHLLPVYDKPMIFLPLSVLMLMGLKEILIITTPDAVASFQRLLGDGARFGVDLRYAVQEQPRGLPEGLTIGEKFLDGAAVSLMLGDNILHGQGLSAMLARAELTSKAAATLFAYEVADPSAFGVATIDGDGRVTNLVEKPAKPESHWAVIGLYMFDGRAPQIARGLKPGPRGETEIVDVLRVYMNEGSLAAVRIPRGIAWLDMGTPENLLSASEYFRLMDSRQRLKIAVPEEIAWRWGWIGREDLVKAAAVFKNTQYGAYLLSLAESE